MRRTILSVPEDLLERVRSRAAEEGVSMAAFMRRAIEERLASEQPKPRSLGFGASGHRETGRRMADERLEPRSWR